MATTRLMPLHSGKGRTVAEALGRVTDYVKNPEKTNGGDLVTAYQCNPSIADQEFLFSKRQYAAITGRERKDNDVITYHLRQSFKPGEIAPELANKIGYELAMSLTKGKHAFIVCTHVDKHHMEELDGWRFITAVSGWRSQEEQHEIYIRSLWENGEEFTKQFVARPGHSEHQTGLAIDLGLTQPNIDFLRPYFPYEGICQTFRERAAAYGFIERYPAGKEAVTGIAHEPWHFRYVGVPHAEIMVAHSGMAGA